MKKLLPLLALVALPACMGEGSDSGVDLTPDLPDASMNADMGVLLNGVRSANSQLDLEYNSTVGQAAQIHANDMFENEEVSIFIAGTANDMGDTLRDDLFFDWSTIVQMVNQGDFTLEELFADWEANGSPTGSGGGTASDLNDLALDDADFEFFGIGKAGSGSDQYWALLLVDD